MELCSSTEQRSRVGHSGTLVYPLWDTAGQALNLVSTVHATAPQQQERQAEICQRTDCLTLMAASPWGGGRERVLRMYRLLIVGSGPQLPAPRPRTWRWLGYVVANAVPGQCPRVLRHPMEQPRKAAACRSFER